MGGDVSKKASGGGMNLIPQRQVEVWSARDGRWRPLPAVPEALVEDDERSVVVLPSGAIFYVSIDRAIVFDPATRRWREGAAIDEGGRVHRRFSVMALPGDRVLLCGGQDGSTLRGSTPRRACRVYDRASDRWADFAPLVEDHRAHQTLLLADGRIVALGGTRVVENPGDAHHAIEEQPATSVEIYSPQSGQWRVSKPLPAAVRDPRALVLADGRVLVIGRAFRADGSRMELFDPVSESWTTFAADVRHLLDAVVLTDGRVFVAGADAVRVWDPKTGTWTDAAPLDTDLGSSERASLVAIDRSRVMLVGTDSYRRCKIWSEP